MVKKLSKTEAEKQIDNFFVNIKTQTPKEIKKIKKLAMRNSVKLKDRRKLFCKKCFSVFNSANSEVRIKKGMKIVKCKECDNASRRKMKSG